MGEVKRKVLIAAFVIALSLAVIVAAIFAAATDAGRVEERPVASQLDMVAYDPPEWAKGRIEECWYVKDRKTNSAGWILKVDREWLVIPVSSKEDVG